MSCLRINSDYRYKCGDLIISHKFVSICRICPILSCNFCVSKRISKYENVPINHIFDNFCLQSAQVRIPVIVKQNDGQAGQVEQSYHAQFALLVQFKLAQELLLIPFQTLFTNTGRLLSRLVYICRITAKPTRFTTFFRFGPLFDWTAKLVELLKQKLRIFKFVTFCGSFLLFICLFLLAL